MMVHDTRDIVACFRLQRRGFGLDVDLRLPGRGVSVLYGASGSGKTTLLRCMAGLERATGRFEIAAQVWQDDRVRRFLPPHRRALGYVFQEPSLFAHLDVLHNIEYGLRRSERPHDRSRLDQAVAMLGIGALLRRWPAQLSGGEQQRVGMARALASWPRLLLMDEPLAALDEARKSEILPYLDTLHRELAIPVVYVSHAADEVARLADHVVLLDGGRVRASGPVAEMFSRTDLALAQRDEAGAVIDACVETHDARWHLSGLRCPAGLLWVRQLEVPPGTPVRARIAARDVSLALQGPRDTSILNSLPARVCSLVADVHPSQVLVQLDAAGVLLLARITRRSLDALALAPGMQVWAQVKSVAVPR